MVDPELTVSKKYVSVLMRHHFCLCFTWVIMRLNILLLLKHIFQAWRGVGHRLILAMPNSVP
jgi:hypothetical protein